MKKRILSVLLAGLMGATVLAGCGSSSSTSSKSAATSASTSSSSKKSSGKLDTVKIAYMPNYASTWDAITADKKGYFKDEGIKVEFTQFQDGPTEIASMESGSIDVAYIGPGAHTLAIKGNVQVFCFDHLSNADCIIGNKKNGVSQLSDLKGKKVGYASGTTSETILNRALAASNLSMSDIKAIDMDVSNMASAMMSGSIDAAAVWSPTTKTIEEQLGDNAVELCNNTTFSDEAADCASWIATPDFAKNNKDLLVRFTRALYKAMDYGSQEKNYDEVAGYVAELCGTDKQAALDQDGDGAWLDSKTLLKYVDDGTLEKYYQVQQDGFVSNGKIQESDKTDVSNYVLFDIMKEAGKES